MWLYPAVAMATYRQHPGIMCRYFENKQVKLIIILKENKNKLNYYNEL